MKRAIALVASLSASMLGVAEEDIPASPDAAASAVIESAKQTTPALQTKKTAPKYPMTELRKGREAWVHVTYCIDETGAIQNVSVLDSIGGKNFDKAAMKTVQSWKFEPALRNGEPVWQSRNNILVTFAIEGDGKGASRKFIGRFRKLGELIVEGQLVEADELFWKTYETFDLNLYELAKLWSQRVRYEAITEDFLGLDMALHRAGASGGEWIEKDDYTWILNLRAQIELRIGKYDEARDSFEMLVEHTSVDAEEVQKLRPVFDRLDALIASDEILEIKAEVRSRGECAYCNDSWDFTPVRNDFMLQNVSGNLTSIDMRCDNRRFESDVQELVEWHIPDSWGKCHVQIYGEPGSTFDVMMLPPGES